MFSGAMQAAGEGAPWACRALFAGASCAMSDDWLLQQRRLQRVRQQEAAERARDAAVAAAAQVWLRNHASASLVAPQTGTPAATVSAVAARMAGCRCGRQFSGLNALWSVLLCYMRGAQNLVSSILGAAAT